LTATFVALAGDKEVGKRDRIRVRAGAGAGSSRSAG
jgi:hypothetical protein